VGPAGLGVLLGVIVVGRVTRRIPGPILIDRALALAGLVLFLLAVSKDGLDLIWVGGEAPLAVKATAAASLAAILGVCNAFILVPAQTLLQERSPEHIRARIYATFFTISNTACFVPILFAAAMADVVGVVKVLVAVALVIGGIGISSLTRHHDWPKPPGKAEGFLARRAEIRAKARNGAKPTASDSAAESG
jgi:MFS family permease